MTTYEPLRGQSHSPATIDPSRESIELEDRPVSGSASRGREDHEPLLAAGDQGTSTSTSTRTEIDPWAIACLLLQHASSTLNTGAFEFATFLFLIHVFPDTLVPASLVGLCTKAVGLAFSGWVGGKVDTTPRLPFVRRAIICQKAFKALVYGLFLVLMGPLGEKTAAVYAGTAPTSVVLSTGVILALIIMSTSALALSSAGIEVAIERDWVTTIAQNDERHLTKLNTYMRRIDLFSKLGAPLVVSLLTSIGGYLIATTTLLCAALITLLTEFWWIEIVYRRFPVLSSGQNKSTSHTEAEGIASGGQQGGGGVVRWLERTKSDWAEFSRLPIFFSSVAIAAIYLTTLSYDGTFIAYLKSARGRDDSFIASMRAVCLITGLIGTLAMPRLERLVGLERAGAWSIWFEVVCLTPALLAFFYGTGPYGEHGQTWNSVLLFGGIALSRIGLWSFDLCQLKELQLALNDHPNRNRLTALQIALQNLFDLLKYALTLSAATPRSFKWTALVSFIAVISGGLSYAVYLRRVRGHLIHFDWCKSK